MDYAVAGQQVAGSTPHGGPPCHSFFCGIRLSICHTIEFQDRITSDDKNVAGKTVRYDTGFRLSESQAEITRSGRDDRVLIHTTDDHLGVESRITKHTQPSRRRGSQHDLSHATQA
ncbi:hypothetical protein Aple_091400 [Acrocarpospora pleiomorpha]|uniref:Uncharacterized protein n=1 Tax=Acrocarpospora pleiomorpha TaxID=90975 RepID=A0A5M3Y363_9ACTN|nr:hypothetical protein Aple_091400 [Acrocarpospora pleiomorpha]